VEIDAAPEIAVPVNFDFPDLPMLSSIGRGKYETHFRIGSEAHLVQLAACPAGSQSWYNELYFSFSEGVVVPDPPPVMVTIDGNPVSCMIFGSLPAVYGPKMILVCNPAPSAEAKLSVTISAGITANETGLPVDLGGTDPSSRTIELPPVDEADAHATCRGWRESNLP
jgi:hypothetical protein